MAKKARIEDIDSDAVINSFRMDDTSIPPQARRPERRRRNGKPEKTDYDGTFVCEANVTARLGKQVYIRKEYHDRIQKMLHVIGGNEVTIASFLDNVLTHHFTQFQEEIAESFRRHMESYNL